MVATVETITAVEEATGKYKYGFVTDIESEKAPKGLNEDIVRFISAKKNEPEWMLNWRLKAYRHWLKMPTPDWSKLAIEPIDYNDIYYYSAPKSIDKLNSLDEVDPELLATYEKLGIPLSEQKMLAGVAVDAVFDSVSVATTFKEELGRAGVIFCPISEAIQQYPELVKKYLGSVIPVADNYFSALNCAVFTDGSFVYVPKGVRCPMELSTYFRINEKNTGQFERTLIIVEDEGYVSYLEGCTAPQRDENQLHAAVVELYSVAVTNGAQQADTGTKMIHLGEGSKSTIISKGISAGKSQNTYRGLVEIHRTADTARNFTQCDSLLVGQTCGAHTVPYIVSRNPSGKIEHEATTSRISEEQLFYCLQRGMSEEDAVSLIVNGFCKEVMKELPMEFAVEAQKLIGISLEGSVG